MNLFAVLPSLLAVTACGAMASFGVGRIESAMDTALHPRMQRAGSGTLDSGRFLAERLARV